ncbi:hypothetical protein [Parasitella parasitica]|uniref:GATA-type domain-containing protein n=1 Tax=Parasitella parasitica TaxID=35722 RepID=A0A0B7MVK1_9FUNG|nr:hypothetical protein [Parasitella parasitica]
MSVSSCYWALLTLENFEFIYLPSLVSDIHIAYGVKAGDVLMSKSLLDFIHPDELSLATTDLLNFVRIKTLAGAVTRCRLRSIKSLIYQEYGDDIKMDSLQNWTITDVVMYTATNNLILAFFHSLQLEIDNTTAGDPLDTPLPTAATTTTITTTNTYCCGSEQLSPNEANRISSILQQYSNMIVEPLRLFQIYHTQCQQLLISGPKTPATKSVIDLTSSITLKEMDRRLQHPQLKSDAAACTHHSHSKSNMMLESNKLCQIERIIITYGNLTFSCFQITTIQTDYYTSDNSNSNDNNIPNQTFRKSNLSKILNNTTTITAITTTASHVTSPATSPTQQTNPHPHDVQTNKRLKNDKTADYLSSQPLSAATSETFENAKSLLPRAWRGRFGVFEKKCENCQTNTSPEWRKGPGGHKTLCNACGLRYARLVAKHEKLCNQQQPKTEDQATLFGVNIGNSKSKGYKPKK